MPRTDEWNDEAFYMTLTSRATVAFSTIFHLYGRLADVVVVLCIWMAPFKASTANTHNLKEI